MTKKIFIYGSTGSIGQNSIKSVLHLNSIGHKFQVIGLAASVNFKLLEKQILQVKPKVVYIKSEKGYSYLKKRFSKIKIFSGVDGFVDAICSYSFDTFLNSVVGSAGLLPTMTALNKKCDIALANKETLVMAGQIVKREVSRQKVNLIPIDSEHSAIFQLLRGHASKDIAKIIITASGGPFYFNKIKNPTLEQALTHPTWKMGQKITIDSATMMNKGFEVIEAHYLFDVDYDKIETIVHPQSIVHSMVETIDGEIYAQLGKNDMCLPIQNALTFPDVYKNSVKPIRLWEMGDLSFFPSDMKSFPLLQLAYSCGRLGGTALTALNAANEGAVALFLNNKIKFKDIYRLVEREVSMHTFKKRPTLDYILDLDRSIKDKLYSK